MKKQLSLLLGYLKNKNPQLLLMIFSVVVLFLFAILSSLSSCHRSESLAYHNFTNASVIVEPEAGENPVADIINHAKKSIKLSIYSFIGFDGGVTKPIKAIARAKKRGVKVTILMNRFERDGWPSSGYQTLKYEKSWCAAHEIRCIPSSTAFTFTHNKYLVIDGQRVYLMTGNLAPEDFGAVRNFIVKINDGTIVSFFKTLFSIDLKNAKHGTLLSPKSIPLSIVLSPVDSTKKIAKFIRMAKKNLDIYAMYFNVTMPKSILRAVIRAGKRGVKIRVISNAQFDHSTFDRLVKKKLISLKLVDEKTENFFIHTKVFIRDDDSVLLGSINMSDSSLHHNREVSYITVSPEVVKAVSKTFNYDWRRFKNS